MRAMEAAESPFDPRGASRTVWGTWLGTSRRDRLPTCGVGESLVSPGPGRCWSLLLARDQVSRVDFDMRLSAPHLLIVVAGAGRDYGTMGRRRDWVRRNGWR